MEENINIIKSEVSSPPEISAKSLANLLAYKSVVNPNKNIGTEDVLNRGKIKFKSNGYEWEVKEFPKGTFIYADNLYYLPFDQDVEFYIYQNPNPNVGTQILFKDREYTVGGEVKTGYKVHDPVLDNETLTFPPEDKVFLFDWSLIDGAINLYYNNTENSIIYLENITNLDEALTVVGACGFDFRYQDYRTFDNRTLQLNYKDHEGYGTGWGDQILKRFVDSDRKIQNDRGKRQFIVRVNDRDGRVSRFPMVRTAWLNSKEFVLEFKYEEHVMTRIVNDDWAIKLKFKSYQGMLYFLNLFYFNNRPFNAYTKRCEYKSMFIKEYNNLLDKQLIKGNVEKDLVVLYYLHDDVLYNLDFSVLWRILSDALKGSLTNAGTNKEDIVLRLLDAIINNERIEITSTQFLSMLINTTYKGKSFFYLLFNKMNTDNFVKYNTFLNQIWRQSDYVIPDHKAYKDSDAPLVLPYESDKFLGFYFSNIDTKFDDKRKNVLVEYTSEEKVIASKFQYSTSSGIGKTVPVEKNKVFNYNYHPFQPILLKDIDKLETPLQLDRVIPAFMLRANDAKAFWSNVVTGTEYAVDVITTLSGVGNILKFRHLTKLTKLQKVIAAVKFASGAVEITSGTVNALLKLTGVNDTAFGEVLSKYLFYLELFTLTGELAVGIKGYLRNSAEELLEHNDFEKHLDDLVEKGEINEVEKYRAILSLEDVSEGGIKKFKNLDELFDISGGKLLTKNEIKLLKYHLWGNYGVRLRLVDVDHALKTQKTIIRNGKKISKLEDWNQRNVMGSFREGTPPQLFLRQNYASELTVFHEMVHLKYWFNKGKKLHFAQEEVVVFDEIWKTKDRWTNKELLDSYNYVLTMLKENDLPVDLKKFINKYDAEIYQIELKIQYGI